MKAVLIPTPEKTTVELSDDNGERFGVHWFDTMDEALAWMKRIRLDYVIELPRAAG